MSSLTPLAALTGLAGTGVGFIFGYDIGVMSGALVKLANDTKHSKPQDWGLDEHEIRKEIIVTMALATAALGSIVSTKANNTFGRRLVIIIGGLIFALGSVIMAFAFNWVFLTFGRGVAGFGFGLQMTTIPQFIAEQMPIPWRGPFNVMNQLMITLGIEISAITDGLLATTPSGWRYMLGLGSVPGILMVCLMLKVPESCRWLAHNGKPDQGRAVLERLRGTTDVEEEWEYIQEETLEREQGKLGQEGTLDHLLAILRDVGVRRALLVGVLLQFFQQFSGVNSIIYYSSTIVLEAGIASKEKAIWMSAVVGAINFLFTLVGVIGVERVGRKVLLLGSLTVMLLALLLLTITFSQIGTNLEQEQSLSWVIVVGLCLFCAGFAPGMGPLPWTLCGEIFPMWCRDTAVSITSLANWASNSVVTLTFLSLTSAIGSSHTFLLFAGVTALAILYFSLFLPETKGLPLEKINSLFERQLLFPPCSPMPNENEFTPLTTKEH